MEVIYFKLSVNIIVLVKRVFMCDCSEWVSTCVLCVLA